MAVSAKRAQLILDLIPQQPPFRFIDAVVDGGEKQLTGLCRFPEDAFFYAGHFPGNPVTPGVILIETMAQTGVVGLGIHHLLNSGEPEEQIRSMVTLFTLADGVEFFSMVAPGETVEITGELVYFRKRSLKSKVSICRENGEMVCRGVLTGTGVVI